MTDLDARIKAKELQMIVAGWRTKIATAQEHLDALDLLVDDINESFSSTSPLLTVDNLKPIVNEIVWSRDTSFFGKAKLRINEGRFMELSPRLANLFYLLAIDDGDSEHYVEFIQFKSTNWLIERLSKMEKVEISEKLLIASLSNLRKLLMSKGVSKDIIETKRTSKYSGVRLRIVPSKALK